MSNVKWVNLIPLPRDNYKWGTHTVYLVHAPRSELYKIGWSERAEKRVLKLQHEQRQLEIATPPYRIIHTIDTLRGRYLERQLHLLFAHRHIANEWYRLTRSDAQWIIDLGDELDYGIPLDADVVPPLAEESPSWDK